MSAASAQSLPPAWQTPYDGPAHGNDTAVSVAVLPSGDVAVAGTAVVEEQPGVLVPHFLAALYTAQGAELWSNIHVSGPSTLDGAAERVAISPSGKIVFAGTRGQGSEWIVVQFDPGGTKEWEGVWQASSTTLSHIEDLDFDPFGDIYVSGDLSSGAGVAKFSSTGALQWVQAYQGTGVEIGSVNALAINDSGEVFLTGSTSGSSGEQLFSVARIEPANGLPLWIRNFAPMTGFSFSEGGDVETDAAGNAIACGRVSDYLAMTVAISTVVVAPDGSLVWRCDHDDPTAVWGIVEDIAVDASGNVFAAGWTASGGWDIDGFVLQMQNGAFAWERKLTSASFGDDRAIAVGLDAHGNVYAAGWLDGVIPGYDVFEYSPGGGVVAHGRAPGPAGAHGFAHALGVGTGGRAYVVGDMSLQVSTGGDALTVAFDLGPPVDAFCFGDGSGTACPCANASAVGSRSGCLSSIGLGGALSADGAAHVGFDTLALHATGLPNGPGMFFQGTLAASGGAGVTFGDGLLCVTGAIVPLGVVFAANHASDYPSGPSPVPISIGGACAPGDARQYQVWYRDASLPYCTSAVFNLTSALRLTWIP